jgi:hypothetical protein
MTGSPESQRAKEHVERIAVLCWIMLGMHLLAAVGIAVNLLLYLGGDRTLHGQSSAFREGQAIGQVVGIAIGFTVMEPALYGHRLMPTRWPHAGHGPIYRRWLIR